MVWQYGLQTSAIPTDADELRDSLLYISKGNRSSRADSDHLEPTF
jgi:hypothetical protein